VGNKFNLAIVASLPWLLAICLGIVVANRPVHVGADTETYIRYFDEVRAGFFTIEDFARIEPGFYWLTYIVGSLTDSPAIYFFTIFFFQFVGITTNFGKRAKIFSTPLLLPLVWLSYPFFYSLTLNVLRQGVAFVFVVYALDRRICGNSFAAYVFILIATAFHQASILFLIPLLILDCRISTRALLATWLFVAAFSAVGVIPALVNALLQTGMWMGLTSHFLSYADSSVYAYETGFRFHFLLFSSIPIIIYRYLQRYGVAFSREGMVTFHFYISISILYFLAVGFAYSDRVALLSWLILPFLLSVYNLNEVAREKFFTTHVSITLICILSVLAPIVFCYFYFVRDHFPEL
jgi:hypothetical protein